MRREKTSADQTGLDNRLAIIKRSMRGSSGSRASMIRMNRANGRVWALLLASLGRLAFLVDSVRS